MTEAAFRLEDDPKRIGHAIIDLGVQRQRTLLVAVGFIDGTFLGEAGRRARRAHLFATEALDPYPCRRFRLGGEIVEHVREAEVVSFHDEEGAKLGVAVWEGIRVLPNAGSGLRTSTGAGATRKRSTARAPIFSQPFAASPIGSAAIGTEEGLEKQQEVPVPPVRVTRPKKLRARAAVCVWPKGVGLLACAAVVGIYGVLAGFVGWRVDPLDVRFQGSVGGPFAPQDLQVRLQAAWYAAPIFAMASLKFGPAPRWLDLHQESSNSWLTAHLSASRLALEEREGIHAADIAIVFPLRTVRAALHVVLQITPVPPSAPKPQSAPRPLVQTPTPAVATIDDALCDRLAGNRFDADHPALAGSHDEAFDLSPADLDLGIAACDAGTSRSGADRRFPVQRGRLLASRALLRLGRADLAAATADMDSALALWRHGEAQGSAYAVNLLGAYYAGVFNRPAHAFVAPDEGLAATLWKKAMDGGNVVAERNYAAQLLAGRGVTADPARAVALLRDASIRGDVHATAILGIALVTGSPKGVTGEKVKGWPLVIRVQCFDKAAAALVETSVSKGEQPPSIRRACP